MSRLVISDIMICAVLRQREFYLSDISRDIAVLHVAHLCQIAIEGNINIPSHNRALIVSRSALNAQKTYTEVVPSICLNHPPT